MVIFHKLSQYNQFTLNTLLGDGNSFIQQERDKVIAQLLSQNYNGYIYNL